MPKNSGKSITKEDATRAPSTRAPSASNGEKTARAQLINTIGLLPHVLEDLTDKNCLNLLGMFRARTNADGGDKDD